MLCPPCIAYTGVGRDTLTVPAHMIALIGAITVYFRWFEGICCSSEASVQHLLQKPDAGLMRCNITISEGNMRCENHMCKLPRSDISGQLAEVPHLHHEHGVLELSDTMSEACAGSRANVKF